MIQFPFYTSALRVVQPIGTFYVAVLPAELLLQVSVSDVMSATLNPDGVGYSLSGTQRVVRDDRISAIANYINRVDSSFPNTIILAPNYDKDRGFDLDEVGDIDRESIEPVAPSDEQGHAAEAKEWTVSEVEPGRFELCIPTAEKLVAIIDGQHRLFSFAKADAHRRENMDLICSIFLDLPKALQAQLFATINSNQVPVGKSLTFELFGYNVSDEPDSLWTPDKLAVFLARKLATDDGSALKGRIAVAPKRDDKLLAVVAGGQWRISMAVVVDGILRLISTNPKRDENAMRTPAARQRGVLADGVADKSPMREEFISGNDALIYAAISNYVSACDKLFWSCAKENSYIIKTIGVQALFDIFRKILPSAKNSKKYTVSYFEDILRPAASLDFSKAQFQVPAGAGRSAIRKAIEEKITI